MLHLIIVVAALGAGPDVEVLQRTQQFLAAAGQQTGEEMACTFPKGIDMGRPSGQSAESFYAEDRFIERVLEKQQEKFTDEQLKKFRELFPKLLDARRPVTSEHKGTRCAVRGAEVQGGNADVVIAISVPEEDLEMEVTLHWERIDGTWKVGDLSIDGASLAKDYQNQFGRIIAKHGVDGLLERLEKKVGSKPS